MIRTRWPEWENFDKLNVGIDINNIIQPSLLLKYIDWSETINKLLSFVDKDNEINSFKTTYLDNIDFLKTAIAKSSSILDKKEKVVLENLWEINKRSKESVKKLVEELFSHFLPKAFKVDDYLDTIKDNAFLCIECYEKVKNSWKIWERIVFDLYLVSVNYLISYYKYLANISKYVPKTIEKMNIVLDKKVKELYSKLKLDNHSDIERLYIWQLLLVLINDLENNEGSFVVDSFIQHLDTWRVKTIDSAVKKLFKSSKYREQFYRIGILPDQIGMMFIYEDIWELKQIASYFYEKSKKWNFVWKFNDRWVLEKQHENQDTIKWITPFVNTEIVWYLDWKELPFGELSLRMDTHNQISKIFENSNDDFMLLHELISKIDFLNHEIYKLSQDIKVLRRFLINNDVIKSKNLNSSISKYLSFNIRQIRMMIERDLPWIFKLYRRTLPINFSSIIELIINNVLLDKLEWVIDDIAWESVLYKIKQTSWYNKLKDEDKRPYLKRLSTKFKKKIIHPTTSLNQYSSDIQRIFEDYKREYKKTRKTALFYKQVESNLSWIKKRIKIENDTNISLLSL